MDNVTQKQKNLLKRIKSENFRIVDLNDVLILLDSNSQEKSFLYEEVSNIILKNKEDDEALLKSTLEMYRKAALECVEFYRKAVLECEENKIPEDILEKEAMSILSKLNDFKKIDGFDHLEFEKDISKDYIYFRGEVIWQYGGNESYSYDFPKSLMFDEKNLENHINMLKKEKEDLEKKEKDRKYQEYLKLKDPFDS